MGRHPLYEVPGDLSPEEIHKYRKRLSVRQALRVLIQHKMDFGIFILGKAIVENSRGEPSRDDDDHEDSNGGS